MNAEWLDRSALNLERSWMSQTRVRQVLMALLLATGTFLLLSAGANSAGLSNAPDAALLGGMMDAGSFWQWYGPMELSRLQAAARFENQYGLLALLAMGAGAWLTKVAAAARKPDVRPIDNRVRRFLDALLTGLNQRGIPAAGLSEPRLIVLDLSRVLRRVNGAWTLQNANAVQAVLLSLRPVLEETRRDGESRVAVAWNLDGGWTDAQKFDLLRTLRLDGLGVMELDSSTELSVQSLRAMADRRSFPRVEVYSFQHSLEDWKAQSTDWLTTVDFSFDARGIQGRVLGKGIGELARVRWVHWIGQAIHEGEAKFELLAGTSGMEGWIAESRVLNQQQ